MSWDVVYKGQSGVTAASDWLARSTASGVVWAHPFDSHYEVDQFRDTDGYGMDPRETGIGGTGLSTVQWISDGPPGANGALRLLVPTGGQENGRWSRCMSPVFAGQPNGSGGVGNGRLTNDPALAGAISKFSHDSSATGSLYNHRKGYYANAQVQSDIPYWPTPGTTDIYDGTEFYLSFAVRISGSRWHSGNPAGKLILIAVTEGLSNLQELVVRSFNNPDTGFSGQQVFATNPWGAYTSRGSYVNSILSPNQGNYSGSIEPGGPFAGTCVYGSALGAGACWEYPADDWAYIQLRLKPGQDNAKTGNAGTPADYTGNQPAGALSTWPHKDTILQVWKCDRGETAWTTIFDHSTLAWFYYTDPQSGTNGPTQQPSGAWHPPAFNCMDFSAYMNNVDAVLGWNQDIGNIIFSQTFQAAPASWL